jgi:hypothetical protein
MKREDPGVSFSDNSMFLLRLKENSLIKSKYISTYFSKKVVYPYLGMYGIAICLIVIHQWYWAGHLTFLGAVILASFAITSFGMWLDFIWKLASAALLGTMLGLCVALCYNYHDREGYQIAYSLVFFSTLTALNKLSFYDRIGKVVGCVTLVITGLDPLMNPFAQTTVNYSWNYFYSMVGAVLLPFMFTAGTLLFPFPMFAFYEAQARISLLCVNLSTCIGALSRGFCSPDKVELYKNVAKYMLKDVEENINNLALLASLVELEERYFSPVFLLADKVLSVFSRRNKNRDGANGDKINFSAFIQIFLVTARTMRHDLKTLDEALYKIQYNHTHGLFVEHLRGAMFDMAKECNDMLHEIFVETNKFSLVSNRTRMQVPSRVAGFLSKVTFVVGPHEDPLIMETEDRWADYLVGRESRSAATTERHEPAEVVTDVEMGVSSDPVNIFAAKYAVSVGRVEESAVQLLKEFLAARAKLAAASSVEINGQVYSIRDEEIFRDSKEKLEDGAENPMTAKQFGAEHLSETLVLSLGNIVPRGAFVHRFLKIKDGLVTFSKQVSGTKPYDNGSISNIAIGVYSWLNASIMFGFQYVVESMQEFWTLLMACVAVANPLARSDHGINAKPPKVLSTVGFAYVQPLKIAGAISISTLFLSRLSSTSEVSTWWYSWQKLSCISSLMALSCCRCGCMHSGSPL